MNFPEMKFNLEKDCVHNEWVAPIWNNFGVFSEVEFSRVLNTRSSQTETKFIVNLRPSTFIKPHFNKWINDGRASWIEWQRNLRTLLPVFQYLFLLCYASEYKCLDQRLWIWISSSPTINESNNITWGATNKTYFLMMATENVYDTHY